MPATIGNYKDCLTTAEVATMLGRSLSSFQGNYRELGVPHLRIGGRVWFLESEVLRWIDQQAVVGRQHQRVEASMARGAL